MPNSMSYSCPYKASGWKKLVSFFSQALLTFTGISAGHICENMLSSRDFKYWGI